MANMQTNSPIQNTPDLTRSSVRTVRASDPRWRNVAPFFWSMMIIGFLSLLLIHISITGHMQTMMRFTTPGSSYSQLVERCGEPINSLKASDWIINNKDRVGRFPAECTVVKRYSFYGSYCYVFVDATGTILGSFWFDT